MTAAELSPQPWPGSSEERGRSVLVYSWDGTRVEEVLERVGNDVPTTVWWIDLVEPGAAGPSGPAYVGPVAGADRRLRCEPSELLPQYGLANLSRWVAGRSESFSDWVEDAEELSWLPSPLQVCLRTREPGPGERTVVLAGGDRLFASLPQGLDDARRLIAILSRRGVSLIVGFSVRPYPEFAALFDRVARVSRGSGEPNGTAVVAWEWVRPTESARGAGSIAGPYAAPAPDGSPASRAPSPPFVSRRHSACRWQTGVPLRR